MKNTHIRFEKFIEGFCDERFLEIFSNAIKVMHIALSTSFDNTIELFMDTAAMSYKDDSQLQCVSLNDTEEVGNVSVTNVTISHFRRLSNYFIQNLIYAKTH